MSAIEVLKKIELEAKLKAKVEEREHDNSSAIVDEIQGNNRPLEIDVDGRFVIDA